MPEYLAPGVFVEEVSFRSKSIEGVSTSTTGFAGMTRFGPVSYRDAAIQGPLECEPRLITSYTEFERIYGGLEPLSLGETSPGQRREAYLAHAARAFFENGGKRLYISRVFAPRIGEDPDDPITGSEAWGVASTTVPVGTSSAAWQARWPGALGNVLVKTLITRSKNLAYARPTDALVQAQGVRSGAVIEVVGGGGPVPVGNDPLNVANLRVVSIDADGTQNFIASDGTTPALPGGTRIQLIEARVQVVVGSERVEEYVELAGSPLQRRYVGKILDLDNPESADCPIWLNFDPSSLGAAEPFAPALLLAALRGTVAANEPYGLRLTGGHDGLLASPDDFAGQAADPDLPEVKATGLEALAEVDDISIVALPDSGDLGSPDLSFAAAQRLVAHAERERYRIAVVDGPINSSLNQIREFRAQFDSSYAALYYPWVKIFDPNERFSQGTPPRQLSLPPSGFVTGIYARNDINRGVHKAPANEVINGLTKLDLNVNTPRQEVINPEGINALRYFEGRGHRVWGARTMSSDPEWKYVNVRRLFIFIEHSIDKSSQFAVFEPNNPRLWDNVRRMVEEFLLVLWRDGALLGNKPEEAYFVRCDRTTMTQNDLDNGRLICLIGIAPVKPAEFVIFRIGQWTSDARR